MKTKLTILIVLFFAFVLTGQTVNYQMSNDNILNPERGFYKYTSTGSSGGYNVISTSTLNSYKTNDKITVVQRIFFLRDFINGTPISTSYLNNMQTDFNNLRSSGMKAIIRFTYTSSNASVYQPTKSQILSHISQLAPVLNLNKDVISTIQAGFIGKYGEWYYTNSNEFGDADYTQYTNVQWANRKEVLEAMINLFPAEIPLQLRYIYAKQKMYGNTYVGRIGFYNDAFLAQDGDGGTFLADGNNPPSNFDIAYWVMNTINLPVTGETNAVNAPRTDCTNALVEMNRYDFSLLNKDYLPANITNWQSNQCYVEMEKYLGYRFRLVNSTINQGVLTITLANMGYANLFKDRKAYLIFKNTSTNVEHSFVVDPNFKNCTSSNYGIVLNLSLFNLANGTYKLYLHFPDPLNSNVAYAIQLANTNTWVQSLGYNDLLQTYTFNNLGVSVFIKDDYLQVIGADKYYLSIYDMSGKLVSHSFDVSGLAKGVYVVKINNTKYKVVKN